MPYAAVGPGKPPPSTEAASNISFPLILSDNVAPTLPADALWRFAPITDRATQCVGEGGVAAGTPIPADILCYYGRKVTVLSETGEIVFTGDPKAW